MTCIVGLIDEDRVYIGGDRLATGGGTKYRLQTKKVWKPKNDMIIGSAGTLRGLQILEHNVIIPGINIGESIEHYLAGSFADCLRQSFKSSGHIDNDCGSETIPNRVLLAYQGRLFQFDGALSYCEVTDKYTAIGSGQHFALGSLYSTANRGMQPEERIKLALETAEYYNAYVEGPYDIFSIEVPK